MKINPLATVAGYLGLTRVKKDGEGGGQNPHHGHQDSRHSKDQNEDGEGDTFEVTQQKVNAALEAFQSDKQAMSNGLNAKSIGDGPGLKVVLTDGAGKVVRQYTGEEFVRLRAAAAPDQPSRGKLLDRKL